MPDNTQYCPLYLPVLHGRLSSRGAASRSTFCHDLHTRPPAETLGNPVLYTHFVFFPQTDKSAPPRPVYHASLIDRPDAPPDQHAVPAMNDDDQGPLMRGSVAAALFSATAFTAARVYCSVIVLRRTRREDVIILLSLVGFAQCVCYNVSRCSRSTIS